MKRICKGCGEGKDTSEYYKNKGVPNGKCKSCVKEQVRLNGQKVGNKYDSTEEGVVRVIYKTQKRNQKLRGHGELPYTKNELSFWLYENNFQELYDCWVSSGKTKDSKPSVDRVDSLLPYTFDNMKLITWKGNRDAQYQDKLEGKGSSGLSCHNLRKINLKGEVVATYTSYSEVRRLLGYCVHYPTKKGITCKEGFYWEVITK